MSKTSNYKKTPQKSSSHSSGQRRQQSTAGRSKTSQRRVPQNNVLDLRSIIAKREAEKERAQKTKTTSRTKTKRKKKATRSTSTASKRKRKQTFAIGASIRAAAQRTRAWLSKPFVTSEHARKRIGAHTKKAAPKNKKTAHRSSRRKKKALRPPRVPGISLVQRFQQLPAYARSLAVFVVLSVVIVLPANVRAMLNQSSALEQDVIAASEEGFIGLQNAAAAVEQLDFATAQEQFAAARTQFELAEQEVNTINGAARVLAPYIPGKGKEFAAGTQLITAGKELSSAGEDISAAMAVITSAEFNLEDAAAGEGTELTNVLLVAHTGLSESSGHIDAAARALEAVDIEAVPQDRRAYVAQAQQLLPTAEQGLLESVEMVELLLAFLGHQQEQRHLVLFGNNREIRPCAGGFIGSIGIFDVNKGAVSTVDIPGGGIYDLAGQTRTKVVAPQPLHLINPHWNVQDANWFPHYPECAQKIQQFLEENNNNFSVDIVTSMTPDVVEDILRITGPIDLKKKHGVVIDADNFYETVQVIAEQKFDENPESKQIIADMTPLLFEQLFEKAENPDELLELLTILQTALETKDITSYSNDDALQDLFSRRNWAGELMNTQRSYLHLSVANIGGGKTSKVIDNTTDVHTRIEDDGSVVETVTFTRVHKGPENDELTGLDNFAFVRAYIPEGSEILSATGFDQPNNQLFKTPEAGYVQDEDLQRISGDISLNPQTNVYTNTEFGKQVVGGWMITERGKSATFTIEYRLPYALDFGGVVNTTDNYSLLVQKQAGLDMVLRHTVDIPENAIVEYSYPEAGNTEKQILLESDYFTGMVLSTYR